MARLSHTLAALTVLTLVGCGTQTQTLTGTRMPSSVQTVKADDHDVTHAKLNAIVKATLTDYQAFLFGTVDANKDGVVTKTEYASDERAADAVNTFFATFDGDKNGAVTVAEYAAALKVDATVEAYHHLTEERMSKAIKPYAADKNFEASELRDYLTKDLGQVADWPFIFELMDELDLNKDEKLLSGPGEGPAFLLKFARPQLNNALGVPAELDFKFSKKRK